MSLCIFLAGLISIRRLPVAQYPQITPTVILVSAKFPGASAETLSTCVASPLETAINGVENMIYMFSQSAAPGNMFLKVYFSIGSNPHQALTNIQNRVNLAMSSLPDEVRQSGVSVERTNPTELLYIALQDESGLYDDIFLTDYASANIIDDLKRLKGVSRAFIANGRDYSMRVWLKPDRLAQFNLTVSDVIEAIRIQNAIHTIGEIGQEPSPSGTQLTIPVASMGRLSSVKEFENVIIRVNLDGSAVFLKDVSRIELGAKDYDAYGSLNAKPAILIGVSQDPTSNALDVAAAVKKKLSELKEFFPSGVVYSIPYDTSLYIRVSIVEVIKTLFEAAFLVALVILLFLHNFRIALVPIIAMVVSISGTFAGMYFLGYSINILSLFGMVLAVGIVVDDAIVVVENIEHNIKSGLSPKEAAYKTMQDVTGPIIAIVLSLCAVFIPVGFIGGIPGQFYKQFAFTIVISVILSGFVALTLSPVLSISLFKNLKSPSKFSHWFNEKFEKITDGYIRGVNWLVTKTWLGVAFCLSLLMAIGVFFSVLPLGAVPAEDQGTVMISLSLPDGASLSRVKEVCAQIQERLFEIPEIQDSVYFSGYSLLESIRRTNMGAFFIALKPWDQRKSKESSAASIIKKITEQTTAIPGAEIAVVAPPIIPGIGVVGGFDFWVVNQGQTMQTLDRVVQQIVQKASLRPEFAFFITSIKANCLQLFLDLDQLKAKAFGINLKDVFTTLQVLLGSVYVNDFSKFGKSYQVIAQADPLARDSIDDIGNIFVRSHNNQMIPLKSFVIPKFADAPTLVSRFNGNEAALISVIPNGSPDQVIRSMEELATPLLLPGMSYSWGGLAYQEKTEGGASGIVLLGGFFALFVVLAALYERWSLPLIVLFCIPFGIFGALLAVWMRGLAIDIYFQIGVVALMGLLAKNSILIVEFARVKRDEGLGVIESAVMAAKLRFRAIIMTSMTLVLGMLPLFFSTGAGAASRHSVATGVIGGMVIATFLATFFVPFFFRIVENWTKKD
jgi:hydrophobe/amphiphile efflux-1 (HAE1) family protein